jgi:hypothetical protein
MNRIICFFILLAFFTYPDASGQKDSSKMRALGAAAGYYYYASINEISDPFVFSGGSVDYRIHFRSVNSKYRFECSFNYATISRTPESISIPDYYSLINRDDGHVYLQSSVPSSKETKKMELSFEFYRIFRSVLFSGDYLGAGATERTSGTLTDGNDDPELVSSSLNPGIVYGIALKHDFNIQLTSNISLLSIYTRRSYASLEANLTTEEASDLEFLRDHHKISGVNDYLEIYSDLELSKKISGHFGVQLNIALIYLHVKSPRPLSAVSSITNAGITYTF